MMFHCINTALVRPCNIIVTKCTQGNNFICIIYNHIFWHQGYWWRCQMTEYKFSQWRPLVTQRLSSGDSFLLRVTTADHNRRVEQSIDTQLLSHKCIFLDSILNIQTDNKADLSSIQLTRHMCVLRIKGKSLTLQARGFQEIKVPRFHDNGTGWWLGCQPYAPAAFTSRKYTWYSFMLEAESTQGHSSNGRIMSLKNSNNTIGKRTRDLPVYSVVP